MGHVLGAPSLCRHDLIINAGVDQRFGWVWDTTDGLKNLRGADAFVRFFDDHDVLIQEYSAEIYPLDAMVLWAPSAETLRTLEDKGFLQFRVDVERDGGKVAVAAGYAKIVREG